MKILITTGIFPPDIGGPSRMIEELVRDLRARGFEVLVLTFGGQGFEAGVNRAKGKMDFLKQLIKLRHEFDVIYTFDLYTAGFFSWLMGKLIFRKKLVVRFAGDSAWERAANQGRTKDDLLAFQNNFYGLRAAWHKFLRKRVLLGADKVVAVSEFMKKVAVRIGVPEEKIKVIYNSVDFTSPGADDPDNPADLQSLMNRYKLNDCQVILTVGRLVPWKGIDLLIKALARIGRKDLKLLIVGDGPDLPRLKKMAEDERVVGRIEFAGKVALEKIFNYYSLADVFVLDSQYEGLSHVLLEALGAGKPIITSRSGGNPEVIENEKNGLLVDYGNVEQLAVAVGRILAEEKWRGEEFRNAGRASLQKFNWEKNIEQTVELLSLRGNDSYGN